MKYNYTLISIRNVLFPIKNLKLVGFLKIKQRTLMAI